MSSSEHTVNRDGPLTVTSRTVKLKAKLREVISYYDNIVPIDGSTNQERVLQQRALSSIVRLKRDGTHAETRFHLSPKRTSQFNRRGRQFSRLLAVEVCASALVMLDIPRSEVV